MMATRSLARHSPRVAAFLLAALVLANGMLVACSSSSADLASDSTGNPRFDGGRDGTAPGVEAGRLDDATSADSADVVDADAEIEDPNCLDDEAAPPAVLDGGDGACPTSGACSAACAEVRSHFKLGVAMFAANCIAKLPACDPVVDVIPCVDEAIARACKDLTSPGYCTPLLAACIPDAGPFGVPFSQSGCEGFANAFSAAGRATFKACVDDKVAAGTCSKDVVSCADEIRR